MTNHLSQTVTLGNSHCTIPFLQHEATKKHSERHEPVSQEEIGNSNGLIEIFSISGVKDD